MVTSSIPSRWLDDAVLCKPGMTPVSIKVSAEPLLSGIHYDGAAVLREEMGARQVGATTFFFDMPDSVTDQEGLLLNGFIIYKGRRYHFQEIRNWDSYTEALTLGEKARSDDN